MHSISGRNLHYVRDLPYCAPNLNFIFVDDSSLMGRGIAPEIMVKDIAGSIHNRNPVCNRMDWNFFPSESEISFAPSLTRKSTFILGFELKLGSFLVF
jgi:hypothetical protein